MPRIDTVQVFRWLWVAFSVNDFAEYGHVRVGWSRSQAWDRCVAAFNGEQ